MCTFNYTESVIRLILESFPGSKDEMAIRFNVPTTTIDNWVKKYYKIKHWYQFRQQHSGRLCLTSIADHEKTFEVTASSPQYYLGQSIFNYDTRVSPDKAVVSVRITALSLLGSRLRIDIQSNFKDFGEYWAPVEKNKWVKSGDVRYWVGLNKTDLTWSLRVKNVRDRPVCSDDIQFIARISLAPLTSR